jgi:hypothetical protein
MQGFGEVSSLWNAFRQQWIFRVQPVQVSFHGVPAQQIIFGEFRGSETVLNIDVSIVEQDGDMGRQFWNNIPCVYDPPGINRQLIKPVHEFHVANPRRCESA